MKIIIVGSKGFIGSHLTEYFLKLNQQVLTCDIATDSTTSDYTQVSKLNPDYDPIFRLNNPDICIYAGGNGSVPFSLSDPEMDFQLNTINIRRILESIRKNSPACKFIHFSSAAVYGNPEKLPVKESAIIQPISPYGWHKYLSELLCREYYILYGIPTCSLRVFSVYGDRLTKQLFWDIYQKMKTSKDIELFGTGAESRDFIFISDLVRVVHCITEKATFSGDVINVASGTETSIREASLLFTSLYDKNINVKFNNKVKSGDPVNWCADISKLSAMGYEHSIYLREGLSRYVAWLREKESH